MDRHDDSEQRRCLRRRQCDHGRSCVPSPSVASAIGRGGASLADSASSVGATPFAASTFAATADAADGGFGQR